MNVLSRVYGNMPIRLSDMLCEKLTFWPGDGGGKLMQYWGA